jgi:polar amino acid transport system ATP-binding protein
MSLLEVRNLCKSFGDTVVLDGISFDVEVSQAKVVMGPSGCGKSSLLRCLNRLLEPTSGTILFDGVDVTQPGFDVRLLRQQIGFVFQNFGLYRHLTVLQNVALALCKVKNMTRREAAERARHELARVGMAERHDAYPAALSGGQSQRVAIARALAMDPRLVLFDEPTSSLDPIRAREVVMMINQLHQDGVTILCVTHDISLARGIADRIVFLGDGKVRAEDSFEGLLQNDLEDVRAFFGRQD